MTTITMAPSAQDQGIATRDYLPHPVHLASDRSLPLAPPKSWAWLIEQTAGLIGPPTCGGPAALREATDATVTGRLQV